MKLYIVGTGAGNAAGMTLDAQSAILGSDLVVGYTLYVELLRGIFPEKDYLATGMKSEVERVRLALSEAQKGKTVSLVCSGDSGVYGMAGLALELSVEYPGVEIEVVPGVTAALSGSALLGAPLGHDFAVISLSDLLTPWELIEKRLRMAADTVCGIARNIGREGCSCRVMSLGELRETAVDMFCTVFIGSSSTREINGRMVTPRGYRNV